MPNEYVAKYVHQHDDKLVGFASIDPHDDDAVEQLDYAVKYLKAQRAEARPDLPEHASIGPAFYAYLSAGRAV